MKEIEEKYPQFEKIKGILQVYTFLLNIFYFFHRFIINPLYSSIFSQISLYFFTVATFLNKNSNFPMKRCKKMEDVPSSYLFPIFFIDGNLPADFQSAFTFLSKEK